MVAWHPEMRPLHRIWGDLDIVCDDVERRRAPGRGAVISRDMQRSDAHKGDSEAKLFIEPDPRFACTVFNAEPILGVNIEVISEQYEFQRHIRTDRVCRFATDTQMRQGPWGE
jgi:hypothetical protein